MRTMNGRYSRDSFDRFGDDLCEEILQYLPNKHKSTVECVSHQWLRTIYKRQRDLEIEYFFNFYHTKDDNKCMYKAIKNLLKKCSTVTSISLRFKLFTEMLELKILRKIADTCPHLTSIKFIRNLSNYSGNRCFSDYTANNLRHAYDPEMRSISYRGLHYFGVMCGHRLTSVDFSCFSQDKCQLLMKHCPNLVSLEKIYLIQLFNDKRIDEVFVPQLAEIKNLIIGNRMDLMETFAMRYANTLKRLRLAMNDRRDDDNDSDCLEYLSELTSLEELDLKYECDLFAPQFINNLKQIGINCAHLASLALDVYQISNVAHDVTELFNTFGSFTELTHLVFTTNVYHINASVSISSKMLKECKKLTNICVCAHITELFFINIHYYLPNIKILSIETTASISDLSLSYLSKLKQLKALDIKNRMLDNSLITDNGISDVIENCVQLKSFKFNPLPNITMKTIRKLIEVAINRPHIIFNHYFLFYGSNRAKELQKEVNLQTFPQNLNVNALDFN